MPPQLLALLGRTRSAAAAFTPAQKALGVLGVAILVVGTVALGLWLTRPAMTPLFSGLAPADANAVVDQLRKDGVPYELTAGGGTILVPEAHVYDERLKAAAAGLPSAAPSGYTLLDKLGVTASEFQQDVTFRRAVEGELETTISHLDGIRGASVKLAIPEKTVFTARAEPPTASVFVETAPGEPLTDEKVDAIVHLTSSAVEGLAPGKVTVVDQAGAVLSAAGGTAGSADRRATAYEVRTQAAVQAVLDRVVGPGKATAAVSADMTQQSAQRTTETFGKGQAAQPLAEQTESENYSGSGGGGAAGVLGPDNIAVPGGANGDGEYESTTTTRNNAVDKTTEQRTIPAGELRRQSISVAVDANAGGVDVPALTALVSAAAGADTARGDVVTVRTVAFSTAQADEAASALAEEKAAREAAAQADLLRTLIIAAGALLALLLVGVVLAARARRRAAAAKAAELAALPYPEDYAMISEPEPTTTAMDAIEAPPAQPEIEPLPGPEGDALELERKRLQIGQLAAADPRRTAGLLRNLIDEGAAQ
ncbi:flagellar basal-body MS-ring/collar protein FliF [Sinomonas halotolerans]|uniref:Flagellar M-ring protein n=1 Tax=Sinomonas halotolerans TaxID=1644133 RepID=A0ABU9WYS8_9MICC